MCYRRRAVLHGGAQAIAKPVTIKLKGAQQQRKTKHKSVRYRTSRVSCDDKKGDSWQGWALGATHRSRDHDHCHQQATCLSSAPRPVTSPWWPNAARNQPGGGVYTVETGAHRQSRVSAGRPAVKLLPAQHCPGARPPSIVSSSLTVAVTHTHAPWTWAYSLHCLLAGSVGKQSGSDLSPS